MYARWIPIATFALAVSVTSQTRAQNPCTPLEERSPNASGQRPAFEGQTRACGVTSSAKFEVVTVAKGLENPWAVEPLPGGDLLVTEKPGRMRIVSAEGKIGEPLAGIPAVDARGQGGLLDVALSPKFPSDQTIYWSYSEPRQGGNATSVARGALSPDRRSVQQVKVIFRALPVYDGDKHFGSRLAFGPDGMLYITLGERSDKPMRAQAQRLDSHMGKILRIGPDGSVPKDNPFVGKAGALPEIWSLGHRNIQAAAFDPQGRLWDGRARDERGRRAQSGREGQELWLAAPGVRRGIFGVADLRRRDGARGDGAAGVLLGSGHRPVRRAVLHRRRVPGVAGTISSSAA